jgi:hypothetical protein
MDRAHKIEVRLAHRVEVCEAAKYLAAALGCDDWYVACQHEHLLVAELIQQGQRKYAVRFECTLPVEKAIYHGSKAWWLTIIPLGEKGDLTAAQIAEVKAGLAKLQLSTAQNAAVIALLSSP